MLVGVGRGGRGVGADTGEAGDAGDEADVAAPVDTGAAGGDGAVPTAGGAGVAAPPNDTRGTPSKSRGFTSGSAVSDVAAATAPEISNEERDRAIVLLLFGLGLELVEDAARQLVEDARERRGPLVHEHERRAAQR